MDTTNIENKNANSETIAHSSKTIIKIPCGSNNQIDVQKVINEALKANLIPNDSNRVIKVIKLKKVTSNQLPSKAELLSGLKPIFGVPKGSNVINIKTLDSSGTECMKILTQIKPTELPAGSELEKSINNQNVVVLKKTDSTNESINKSQKEIKKVVVKTKPKKKKQRRKKNIIKKKKEIPKKTIKAENLKKIISNSNKLLSNKKILNSTVTLVDNKLVFKPKTESDDHIKQDTGKCKMSMQARKKIMRLKMKKFMKLENENDIHRNIDSQAPHEHTEGIEKYICKFCDRVFFKRSYYESHCSYTKHIHCNYCNRLFRSIIDLSAHKIQHNHIPRYKCPEHNADHVVQKRANLGSKFNKFKKKPSIAKAPEEINNINETEPMMDLNDHVHHEMNNVHAESQGPGFAELLRTSTNLVDHAESIREFVHFPEHLVDYHKSTTDYTSNVFTHENDLNHVALMSGVEQNYSDINLAHTNDNCEGIMSDAVNNYQINLDDHNLDESHQLDLNVSLNDTFTTNNKDDVVDDVNLKSVDDTECKDEQESNVKTDDINELVNDGISLENLDCKVKEVEDSKVDEEVVKPKKPRKKRITLEERFRRDMLKRADVCYICGQYICDLCKIRYGRACDLDRHIEKHHKIKGKYHCKYCLKEYNFSLDVFKLHTSTHRDQKIVYEDIKGDMQLSKIIYCEIK